jgi:hypothetical protein
MALLNTRERKDFQGVNVAALLLTFVAVVLATPSKQLLAQNRCDAILRGGVFDTTDILDLKIRHEQVKSLTCNSSLSVNLGEPSLSQGDYCNSDFREVVRIDQFVQSIRRASRVIANAWLECVRQKRGLTQYFTTTSDPRRFQYTLLFDVDGAPEFSRIRSWSMQPASVLRNCVGRIPGRDVRQVGDAGITIDCVRPLNTTVTVTVDSVSGRADPITLPAVEDFYVLRMGSPDDESQCFLNGQLILSSTFGTPEKTLLLNPSLANPGTNTLRCVVIDRAPNSNFDPCFSGRFMLEKNGVALFDWQPRCCGAGCPACCNRISFDQSVSIDLIDEATKGQELLHSLAAPPG